MARSSKTARVLLAGESWVTTSSHVKGFDLFTSSDYQTGIGALTEALAGSEVELEHLPGHLVPLRFPSDLSALRSYDVVVLSDIGADSLLLHPDTFLKGQRTANRLKLIKEWVAQGGGLMMIGGYLSFQGIHGTARYHGTPVEEILPITIRPQDDRNEVPEGFLPVTVMADHPILAGLDGEWPYLLGHNIVDARPEADVLMRAGAGDGPPLLVAGTHGKGRTLVWTSDIGPHWLPNAFSDWPGYARLWRRAFLWLAGK